jgi:UDP:flavonoid glycosyltransferase YjiC (YdhE family)
MARFLVVVPPFRERIDPIAAVAAELRGRGHQVVWAGDVAVLSRTLHGSWTVFGCGSAPLAPRPPDLGGFAARKHLWESVLVPLAEWMEPAVRRAVELIRPDVVIADQRALAGALVAQRAGVAWATSAVTSSELLDPLATFSPHLVIAFTTPALVGEGAAPAVFVGPVQRCAAIDCGSFPWDRLDPARPAVLVTMGTADTDAAGSFLRECAGALRARPGVQGVLVDLGESLRGLDGDFLRLPSLPQQAVPPRVAAVVCHAGHDIVCQALAWGAPLVLAPIRDEQPAIAAQVAAAGAGVRLRFMHARAEHIGRALDRVLTVPSFTAAAGRIRDSLAAAGGAPAAADALEGLAIGRRSRRPCRQLRGSVPARRRVPRH